jgi:AraC family transcriptional regulator, regulatory protein of adaptative response / DNA-3-methyladenine glycosylase II
MSPIVDSLLPYRPPIAAGFLLDFLARRSVPGVEEVTDGTYRRSLRLARGSALVELRPAEAQDHVHVRADLADVEDLDDALAVCRRLLDLDCDPRAVDAALGGEPLLAPLVDATPGMRVPGAASGAELAIRAVLGQQISVAAARTAAGRLTAALGEPLARPRGTVTRCFPTAEALAGADPALLAMPAARARALRGLAGVLASGELVLDAGAERAPARRALLALRGIGPWTADYIAMRALRDPDAFLPTDLGVRHALRRLGRSEPPAEIGERWRPYRAYAVTHLWHSLAAAPMSSRRGTVRHPGMDDEEEEC